MGPVCRVWCGYGGMPERLLQGQPWILVPFLCLRLWVCYYVLDSAPRVGQCPLRESLVQLDGV